MKQTARSADIQDHREQENERFCELVDTFGSEPQTRALLMATLEAKAAPDERRFNSNHWLIGSQIC